jgi:uncharacterized membrane protein
VLPARAVDKVDVGSKLDRVLSSPLVGLSPWIIYALAQGEGRLELAVGLALATAMVILALGWLRGSAPKLLEYADVTFFAALAVVVAVASPTTHHWLELWSGEIANLALMAIVLGSLAIRRPFTLQYAREQEPPDLWHDPHFIRANYVITWVWAAAFIVEALSGLYGDAVLHDADNLWTGWIIQTLPLIVAAQFTIWYPRRRKALAAKRLGESTVPPPPVSAFIVTVTPWLTVIGIVVLAAGAAPAWVGIAFIVAGAMSTRALQANPGINGEGTDSAPDPPASPNPLRPTHTAPITDDPPTRAAGGAARWR